MEEQKYGLQETTQTVIYELLHKRLSKACKVKYIHNYNVTERCHIVVGLN